MFYSGPDDKCKLSKHHKSQKTGCILAHLCLQHMFPSICGCFISLPSLCVYILCGTFLHRREPTHYVPVRPCDSNLTLMPASCVFHIHSPCSTYAQLPLLQFFSNDHQRNTVKYITRKLQPQSSAFNISIHFHNLATQRALFLNAKKLGHPQVCLHSSTRP